MLWVIVLAITLVVIFLVRGKSGKQVRNYQAKRSAKLPRPTSALNHSPIPVQRSSQAIREMSPASTISVNNQESAEAAYEINSPLEWKGKGVAIEIGGYTINNPLTYVSKRTPKDEDPSCINFSLPVGSPIREPKGSLGYWPFYGRMSSSQRANYLKWLADGKPSTLEDIGYAFIYFYGLERRVMVDGADLNIVAAEVADLLHKFDFSNSFNNYLSNFLVYIVAVAGVERVKEPTFKVIFEETVKKLNDDGLALVLAWHSVQNISLSIDWAKTVAESDPRSARSVILERVPKEFHELFSKKYQERFPSGLIPHASSGARTISYRPASAVLLGQEIPSFSIPNILGDQQQLKPLVQIWTECIEELKQYGRVVGKGQDLSSREAFEALPEALQEESEHPASAQWERVFSEHLKEDGRVHVPISKLAVLQNIPKRDKLTINQSRSLARTAHYVGIGMEQDSRITNLPYRWDDVIALFRPVRRLQLPDDTTYLGASVILELGMAIASSDGIIQAEEVDYITKFIEGQFHLNAQDAKRLQALKGILVEYPPELSSVTKKLKKLLSEDQREKIGEFLIGIAASFGSIDRAELKALKRAYKAMEVPESRLDEFLGTLRRDLTEPVAIDQAPGQPRVGEAIPAREVKEEPGKLQLDQNRIQAILMQTREVATMLGKAMGESVELEEEHSHPVAPTPSVSLLKSDGRYMGLDARYHGILERLLRQDSWEQSSFESLVREHKLMPSAAIEVINEWADVTLGDLLIEEGDVISINRQLMEK